MVAEDYHALLRRLEDPEERKQELQVIQLPLDMNVGWERGTKFIPSIAARLAAGAYGGGAGRQGEAASAQLAAHPQDAEEARRGQGKGWILAHHARVTLHPPNSIHRSPSGRVA